jgi:hypothetical protein
MPVLPTLNVRSGRTALRPVAVAVLLVSAAALAIGCFYALPVAAGHTPAGRVTASAVQNGVQVTVVVSAGRLQATYRPQRPGFHLYSISLPANGVDGLGVPTRLGVEGGLRATGSPTSDRPVRVLSLRGLGVPLPVYPDGPVTITLPVSRTRSTSARVVVSYGACSTSTCLVPVAALVIPIRLD